MRCRGGDYGARAQLKGVRPGDGARALKRMSAREADDAVLVALKWRQGQIAAARKRNGRPSTPESDPNGLPCSSSIGPAGRPMGELGA